MRTLLLPIGLCVALVACGSDVSLTNATTDQVNAETKAAGISMKVKPGEWQTEVEVTKVEMPGLPPAVADQMAKSIGKSTTHTSCITEAKASEPGELFADDSGKCTYDKFEMSDGKVNLEMRCPGPDGSNASMLMKVKGHFSADSIYATNEIKISGTSAIEMRGNINSRRIGDCKSGAAS